MTARAHDPDRDGAGDRLTVATGSARETRALGRALGSLLAGGEVLALAGPLGAGKTEFVKGVAEGMGIDPREVTSPTFLLIHEIEGPRPLCHADAYRVSGAAELAEEGLEERMGGSWVTAVEWAERVVEALPPDHLRVRLEPTGEHERTVTIEGLGPRSAALVCRLAGTRR